jgi:hypothetical protein
MIIILTLLFILMQPGMILTIPPDGKLVGSQTTSTLAVLVHAAAFFVAAKLVAANVFPFSLMRDIEDQITG